MEENTSEATHGPGWSTETADYLDKLWARHEAEKAEADEKLRLKEERKALRKRKLEERSADDATSASCGKGQTSTVHCELRSRTVPESTLLVEATPDAIDDVRSSKRRRFDAATPTDAPEPHTDSDSVHPHTLLVDCPSTSPSVCAASSASKTAAIDACQNCWRSRKGPYDFKSTLVSGWRICRACYTYERLHAKHRPPELEARFQSRVNSRRANLNCSAPSASAVTHASASGPTAVPIPTCSNCRAPTSPHSYPSALSPAWRICGACAQYERRTKKHRPPEVETARQTRVAVGLGDTIQQCTNCRTTNTSRGWHPSKHVPGRLCFACYLHEHRYKTPRPRALFERTTQKRNAASGSNHGDGK